MAQIPYWLSIDSATAHADEKKWSNLGGSGACRVRARPDSGSKWLPALPLTSPPGTSHVTWVTPLGGMDARADRSSPGSTQVFFTLRTQNPETSHLKSKSPTLGGEPVCALNIASCGAAATFNKETWTNPKRVKSAPSRGGGTLGPRVHRKCGGEEGRGANQPQ